MIFYDGHKVYMNGLYPAIYLNGNNVHVHRLEWEKVNGVIPKGYVVHHKNGNKLDWSITNLELLSRSEHLKEHKDTVKRPPVAIIGYNNNFIYYFTSIKDASFFSGATTCGIGRVIKGTQSHSHGWYFERGE